MVEWIHTVLSWGTLVTHLVILLLLVLFLVSRVSKENAAVRSVSNLLKNHGLLLSFFLALGGTLGSLFYSNILLFEPCVLCWYQRIVMYPLVLILGVALVKKARDVFYYASPLALIGLGISLYQYSLQMFFTSSGPCSAIEGAANCSIIYFLEFGYITMPLMGVTAFTLILIFLYFHRGR